MEDDALREPEFSTKFYFCVSLHRVSPISNRIFNFFSLILLPKKLLNPSNFHNRIHHDVIHCDEELERRVRVEDVLPLRVESEEKRVKRWRIVLSSAQKNLLVDFLTCREILTFTF